MANRFETLVRSRRARLLLAVGLAATALWAFAPYMANEVGGEAWVNAPLTRIASPIAGTVTADLPGPGAHLARAAVKTLVAARNLDTQALGALLDQQAALEAGLTLATRQLAEIAAADARLARRSRRFGTAAAARLDATLDAAEADTSACRADAEQAALQLVRVERLAAQGFATNATLDQARADAGASKARCAALAARATATAGEAQAARAGLYLGASAQDTPYAEQQRDRLLLRRQELETIAAEAEAHLAELGRRIADERKRLARAAAYQPRLPGGHIVWRTVVSAGQSVAAGDPLLEIANCEHRFVEVTLPERRMEALAPGGAARVRMIGGDDWLEGRITGLTGAAARRDAALVAADDSNRDARALTVTIALPPADRASPAGRRCDIGRLAEVRFARWQR